MPLSMPLHTYLGCVLRQPPPVALLRNAKLRFMERIQSGHNADRQTAQRVYKHVLDPPICPRAQLLAVQVGDSAADSAVLTRQAARHAYQYRIRTGPRRLHSSQLLL